MLRYLIPFGLVLSVSMPASAQQAAGCDARTLQGHKSHLAKLRSDSAKIRPTIRNKSEADRQIHMSYLNYIGSLARQAVNPKIRGCAVSQINNAVAAARRDTQMGAAPTAGGAPSGPMVRLFPATVKIAKGRTIAPPAKIRHGAAYGYDFWINPTRPIATWASILHKGRSDKERSPAVFFFPKSTRLHVRIGTDKSWNDGCDAKRPLPRGRWSHVFIQARPGVAEIYVNGRLENRCPIGKKILQNAGPLFAGSPWVPPAVAAVRNVRLTTRPLPPSAVPGIMRSR